MTKSKEVSNEVEIARLSADLRNLASNMDQGFREQSDQLRELDRKIDSRLVTHDQLKIALAPYEQALKTQKWLVGAVGAIMISTLGYLVKVLIDIIIASPQ